MMPFDAFDGMPPFDFNDAGGESWEDSHGAGPDGSAWRGESHLEDWPRESAGPEWRMFHEMMARERSVHPALDWEEAAKLAAAVDELLRSL